MYALFLFRQAACSTHSDMLVYESEKKISQHHNINLNLLINSFAFCSTYFSGYNIYLYILCCHVTQYAGISVYYATLIAIDYDCACGCILVTVVVWCL